MANLSYLILGGGESRRFNGDKKKFVFNGCSLLEHVVNSISIIKPPYISLKKEAEECANSVLDSYKVKSPINGILSFWDQVGDDYICVTCCDMPLITADFYRFLEKNWDGSSNLFILNKESEIMPFPSILSKGSYHIWKNALLQNNLKIKNIVKIITQDLNCQFIGYNDVAPVFGDNPYININRKEDLALLGSDYP